MALNTYFNVGLQGAIGQYITAKVTFYSDKVLTGKLLKIWASTYDPTATVGANNAFQIVYPASPGVAAMTNMGAKNYRADIKVIDDKVFEIHYYFFVTKPFTGWALDSGYKNSTAFSDVTGDFDIGIHAKIGLDSCTSSIPIDIVSDCSGVTFSENGFTPGEDLTVDIDIQGSVNNNFFLGLIRHDAISDGLPIVGGLVANYVQIGGSVATVDTLPDGCISGGNGFIESNDLSSGFVTIDGACLTSNASYQLYIIYKSGGLWKSCFSDIITQTSIKPAIIPIGTYSTTDAFGTTAEACVSGLAKEIPLDLCYVLDQTDYNAQLTAAGYSGTFTDYYVRTKCFKSSSPSSVGGIPISFTENAPGDYCKSNFTYNADGLIYLIFQIEMQFPTHTDFINVPFELNYNAQEVSTPVFVENNGATVSEMCDGDTYTLSSALDPACEVFQSVNGGPYVANSIITGDAIDLDAIPLNGIACFKQICSDGGATDPPEDCDCSACEDLEFQTVEFHDENGQAGLTICYQGDKTITSGTAQVAFTTLGAGTTVSPVALVADCFVIDCDDVVAGSGDPNTIIRAEVLSIEVTTDDDCVYEDLEPGMSIASLQNPPGYYTESIGEYIMEVTSCTCADPEPAPGDCDNYAGIVFSCDEETGEISISVTETFTSTVEDSSFEMSTDGGLTFIPCPATITGEESVFVKYDASFTDGCPPIHLEQEIVCIEKMNFSNTRGIELDVDTGELVVTLDDDFDSTPVSDYMYISLDGGETWNEYDLLGTGYTPLLALDGTENIIVNTVTVFDDGAPDVLATATWNPPAGALMPGYCVLHNASGYEFTVFGIDMLAITNPTTQLEVNIEGNEAIYTSTAPIGVNQYSINAEGELITWSALPLSNALIVIERK